MRRVEFKLSLVYAALLVLLAYVGTVNQGLVRRHAALAQRAHDLSDEIAELRILTAAVDSPEAINAWAVEAGMIPTTEGEGIQHLPPTPAPAVPEGPSGLEMRTLWR